MGKCWIQVASGNTAFRYNALDRQDRAHRSGRVHCRLVQNYISLQKHVLVTFLLRPHTITFPGGSLQKLRSLRAEGSSCLKWGQDCFVFRPPSGLLLMRSHHLLGFHGHHSHTCPLVHSIHLGLRLGSLPSRSWSCKIPGSALFWKAHCPRKDTTGKVTWERSKAQGWVNSGAYNYISGWFCAISRESNITLSVFHWPNRSNEVYQDICLRGDFKWLITKNLLNHSQADTSVYMESLPDCAFSPPLP